MTEGNKDKITVIPLQAFADLLDCNTSWLASICGRLDVPIDARGGVDRVALRGALMRLSDKPHKPIIRNYIEIPEVLRVRLIKRVEFLGFKLVKRVDKAGMILHFISRNKTTFRMFTYVTRHETAQRQVSFSVRNTPGMAGTDWYAFIAEPFGYTYLLSPTNMEERWAATKTKPPKNVSFTFSKGAQQYRFTHRVDEMVAMFEGESL